MTNKTDYINGDSVTAAAMNGLGTDTNAATTKLAGIATGATANSSDATLLARANHTGTQTASTISDFSTAADARITAANLVALAGTQTVTGAKTFNSGAFLDKGNWVNNVKAFGATGDGSTDDTTAITNALAAGGITFFPAGTYIHTGLTFSNAPHILGVGQGKYSQTAPTSQRSILKLKNSTNVNSITIPNTSHYGTIENIEIDGNKVNQTSSGIGLNFVANVSTQEDEWVLRNVEVYNTKSTGIFYGGFRRAIYADRVVVSSCAGPGIDVRGSDTTWIKPISGNHDANQAPLVIKSVLNRFYGGDIFGGSNSPNIVIDGIGHTLVGMGIDHADNDGIFLDTSADEIIIVGNTFHSNGISANNTYADINLSNAGGTVFTITGNDFGNTDGTPANKRKYAIYCNTKTAIAIGNSHASAATATAFTDKPGNLLDTVSSRAPRASTVSNTTSLTVNADTTDYVEDTGLTGAVTINNPTGTPSPGQRLGIAVTGTAARAISFGSAFEASTVALPTTTVTTARLDMEFVYNNATSKWRIIRSV
jgi:hypothetical protein